MIYGPYSLGFIITPDWSTCSLYGRSSLSTTCCVHASFPPSSLATPGITADLLPLGLLLRILSSHSRRYPAWGQMRPPQRLTVYCISLTRDRISPLLLPLSLSCAPPVGACLNVPGSILSTCGLSPGIVMTAMISPPAAGSTNSMSPLPSYASLQDHLTLPAFLRILRPIIRFTYGQEACEDRSDSNRRCNIWLLGT